MTNFQKCILIFIGEFLILLGCLIAAVGSPAVINSQGEIQPHGLAVGAVIVAGLSLIVSLALVASLVSASGPVTRRYPNTPPPSFSHLPYPPPPPPPPSSSPPQTPADKS